MAKGKEADINRRLGRVEMLLLELNKLPADYQPGERETEQFTVLAAKILKVFAPKPKIEPESEAAPAQKNKK